MNPILDPPDSVLLVARARSLREAVESVLAGADVDRVRTAGSTDDALGTLSGADVGCVVLAHDLPDPVAFRRTLCERDEFLPVVFRFDDAGRASELTRTTAPTTLLPVDAPDAALREAVAEHLAAYRERVVTAEEADMLDGYMSELPNPMFVKDEAGRHLRMTAVPGGVDEGVVVGKTDREVYSYQPEAAERFYADDMRVVEEGERILERDERSGPPGDRYWGRTTKVPWTDDDGRVKGLLGLSFDVTDLKEKEQRLERLDDRFDQFASYVTHDVMNPLQVAISHLGLARETGDPEAFDGVERAHDRIEQMLQDLGNLARRAPDSDAPESVDLTFAVEEIWSFMATGEATLRTDMPEGALVHAPADAVRPVLENLLRNAIDHAGDDVTVTVGTLDDGFYVADDGPGIPAEERERITEHGYTTAADGTGTGLAIVAEVVERNNWSLDVASSADGGARIEIRDVLVVDDPRIERTPGDRIELADAAAVGDASGSVAVDDVSEWRTVTAEADSDDRDDDYYFASVPVEGDVRIEARVVGVDHVNDFGAGGLMVRGGLDPTDRYGFLCLTAGVGTAAVWRREPGEESDRHLLDDERGVRWLRVDRVGDTVTYSVSIDGESWTPVDQRRLSLPDRAHVGLAVSGAVPDAPCEARFADVAVRELRPE
ncbi:MAG: ATP-binding protein [Haloarculaceae archaeon]